MSQDQLPEVPPSKLPVSEDDQEIQLPEVPTHEPGLEEEGEKEKNIYIYIQSCNNTSAACIDYSYSQHTLSHTTHATKTQNIHNSYNVCANTMYSTCTLH